MEYKLFSSELKEIDEKELTVDHWISTEEKDRVGDVMIAKGMRIDGKPVVLWSHGHDAGGKEPIGKPLWIRAAQNGTKTGIQARTQFFDDEQGRRLFRKVKEKFLHSWSIGFIPIRFEDIDGGRGRKILEWNLLEYSLVAVPACAGATTLGDDPGGLFFKILPDGAQCDCGGACKGAVKCAGHKEPPPRKLVFQFVDSRPPKANLEEVAAIAAKVVREAFETRVNKELRYMQGKVD